MKPAEPGVLSKHWRNVPAAIDAKERLATIASKTLGVSNETTTVQRQGYVCAIYHANLAHIRLKYEHETQVRLERPHWPNKQCGVYDGLSSEYAMGTDDIDT